MTSVAIICVADVKKTSTLLQKLFQWERTHGGKEFEDLVDRKGKSALWLHSLDSQHHLRFRRAKKGPRGIRIAIYCVVDDIDKTYKTVRRYKLEIIEEIFYNENADFHEFTFQLKEGYFFTVCEKSNWTNI